MLDRIKRVLVVVLVLVNNSPNSATKNVGAAALTILISSTLSMFEGGRRARFFNEQVPSSAVGGTTAVFLVCVILFLIKKVMVDDARSVPLVATLFRATSTVKAMKLSLKVAPSLKLISRVVLVYLVFLNEINKLALVFTALSRGGLGNSGCPRRGVAMNWEEVGGRVGVACQSKGVQATCYCGVE